jgi:hypothetical protein
VQIITLTLSDPEWERVLRIAQEAWPGTALDRQISRNECCRWLLLAGLDSVPRANLGAVERSLRPPAEDDVLPKLPVAGGD